MFSGLDLGTKRKDIGKVRTTVTIDKQSTFTFFAIEIECLQFNTCTFLRNKGVSTAKIEVLKLRLKIFFENILVFGSHRDPEKSDSISLRHCRLSGSLDIWVLAKMSFICQDYNHLPPPGHVTYTGLESHLFLS